MLNGGLSVASSAQATLPDIQVPPGHADIWWQAGGSYSQSIHTQATNAGARLPVKYVRYLRVLVSEICSVFASSGDQPGSSVLNQLQAMDLVVRKTVEQGIAWVQTQCDKLMHQQFCSMCCVRYQTMMPMLWMLSPQDLQIALICGSMVRTESNVHQGCIPHHWAQCWHHQFWRCRGTEISRGKVRVLVKRMSVFPSVFKHILFVTIQVSTSSVQASSWWMEARVSRMQKEIFIWGSLAYRWKSS